MLNGNDKIFIACLIVVELIFLIVCLINASYFSKIYDSSDPVIEEGTARSLSFIMLLYVFLMIAGVCSLIYIYKYENTSIEESEEKEKRKILLEFDNDNSKSLIIEKLSETLKVKNSQILDLKEGLSEIQRNASRSEEESLHKDRVISKSKADIQILKDELKSAEEEVERLNAERRKLQQSIGNQ